MWEFPLAYWLEAQGYDVTYISNLDTHADPGNLRRSKGFLSVGHDEYYTLDMFEAVQSAVSAGVNVAFLSGNTCFGVVALSPDSRGMPQRTLTKTDHFGSPDPRSIQKWPELTRFPWSAPDEAMLIGAHSVEPVIGGADWTCVEPDHWLFSKTHMKRGDSIPGLVGWGWHGDPAPIPGLVVVATDTVSSHGGNGTYTATIYPGPKSNFIFNAATIWWADGLSEPLGYVRSREYKPRYGPDLRVQQITANLLEKMDVRQQGNSME